jgi:hypothetical protein
MHWSKNSAICCINWNQSIRRKKKKGEKERQIHNSETSQRKISNKKTSQTLTFFKSREQILSKPPLQSITSQTKSNTN